MNACLDWATAWSVEKDEACHSTAPECATGPIERRSWGMRRKLTETEKETIRSERLATEQKAFPNTNIDVVVEDFTWANGEPIVRVIHGPERKDKP